MNSDLNRGSRRKEQQMNTIARTALVALLVTLGLALGSRAAELPSETARAVDAAALVGVDLDAEWKRQFDDLARQFAERDWFAKVADETLRRDALILPDDRDPVDVVLRRTEALLTDIQRLGPKATLDAATTELKKLSARVRQTGVRQAAERYQLFVELCRVRRQIALANPLLDFDTIVFVKRHGTTFRHVCFQCFGANARPGGGVYVLRGAFGPRPRLRDVLAESEVSRGRLKGARLGPGSFLSLALSYDAQTLYFAYTECKGKGWAPESCFHVFRAGVDGRDLVQLTDGAWNDFDPWPLPNGRLVFLSERRGGVGRCNNRYNPVYTLHSMNPDGSDIVCLSYHETHEWTPSVANDGRIIYSRWDYVDRGDTIAHHPWVTTPDGRDARAIHGNYPRAKTSRPVTEAYVRAIPGSHKFVGVACAHASDSLGSLVLLDADVPDDGGMSQLRRITPEARFPQAESYAHDDNLFTTPWPLSEDYYLVAYAQPELSQKPPSKRQADRHGIYLVDSFGNRELIYRDAELRSWNPIPLKSRPCPPVLPHQTDVGLPPAAAGKAARPPEKTAGEALGTVAVTNVYDGLKPWPAGTRIAALRIVQLFPKTKTAYTRNNPAIGKGYQALARGSLGTVPVEPDGSAHFLMPAGKAVYFQALDDEGLAVQSMMSATYVHPGERLTCQGCHEPRQRAPAGPKETPLAMRRGPSRIAAEPDGSWPLSFPRLVQPVLDRKCVECHRQQKALPLTAAAADKDRRDWPADFAKSFDQLSKRGWSPAFVALEEKWGWSPSGSRSTPGQVGARASGLWKLLEKGHHGVQLTADERRRIGLWVDTGSNFYGAYHELETQARGEPVRPELE